MELYQRVRRRRFRIDAVGGKVFVMHWPTGEWDVVPAGQVTAAFAAEALVEAPAWARYLEVLVFSTRPRAPWAMGGE